MPGKGLLSVSKFAELTRTTRDALHHYDKIGLLSPVQRGENNYRYYSHWQMTIVDMIRTLQELGMSLDEITDLARKRTPDRVDAMLTGQVEKIDRKVEHLIKARKLLLTLQRTIRSASRVNEQEISIQFLPAEAIVLGDLNDYSQGRNIYDAASTFYQTMQAKYPKLNLHYPIGGLFAERQLKQGDYTGPERYYFSNPEGHDKRPAAQYAVGYARGGYGRRSAELFKRIIGYIEKNGFEICGDAYEEYPLNEISIADDTNYLIRGLVTVCRKKNRNKS